MINIWKEVKRIRILILTTELNEERIKIHYITNIKGGLEDFVREARGIGNKSYHWILDIIFKEGVNKILNKNDITNLNILRKLATSILSFEVRRYLKLFFFKN